MKRLLFVFLAILCIVFQANARPRKLNKFPQSERDSIILAIAKEAMLKYAPEWYSDNLIPEVKYEGYSKHPDYTHRQVYRVFYYLPEKKPMPAPYNWEYLVRVSVWEDTGKLFAINFGPGGNSFIRDEPRNRNLPDSELIFPYPKTLPRPF